MIVLVFIGVIIPTAMIVAAVLWGWKNGTLTETPQDRYDWDFEQLVARFYAKAP